MRGASGGKRVQLRDEGTALLAGHPAVQHQRRRSLAAQGGPDRVKMLGALGQHQDFATLRKRIA